MPRTLANGVELYYLEQGAGEETVVFSHGLLWSHRMFARQIETLAASHRVIAYDHRGQGESEVRGPFDMDTLTADAAALIRARADGPVHFAGLSMGGFVGLRLAARHPELVRSLVLFDTTASAEGAENLPRYRMLNRVVRWLGVRSFVARQVMPIMFSKSWLADPANAADVAHWQRELESNHRSISGPVRAVIERRGVEDELARITCPTLIVVGEEDSTTPPDRAEFMHARIRGSVLEHLPGAGHCSTIEQPGKTSALLEAWLKQHG